MPLSCVMIVDDSEADQFLSKKLIEDRHPRANILQAYDGQEALELLARTSRTPDIIFLDIHMPRTDGHEFLQKYNSPDRALSLVAIMLSTMQNREDIERTSLYHCVKKHIEKPLEAHHLEELEKLLSSIR